MAAAVVAENLTKEFRGGKVLALDGLDLTIDAGEIFGIIGPNGAGKTTFMGCLLGLLHPTSGKLTLDGMPPDSMVAHSKVGFLPERLNFVKWMTALEFMQMHAALAGTAKADIKSTCEKLLERVELPKNSWTRPIKTYSRGMLQRVGMAQALLNSPAIILLDEPSSGLDPDGVQLFRRLLVDAKKSGATIIINSHQLDQLEKICDRVAFIKKGKVQSVEILTGTGADVSAGTFVFTWPAHLRESTQEAAVREIVESAGAKFENFEFPRMTVEISDEKMAALLVEKLCAVGLPIAQVMPQEGRLESIFTKHRKGD